MLKKKLGNPAPRNEKKSFLNQAFAKKKFQKNPNKNCLKKPQ